MSGDIEFKSDWLCVVVTFGRNAGKKASEKVIFSSTEETLFVLGSQIGPSFVASSSVDGCSRPNPEDESFLLVSLFEGWPFTEAAELAHRRCGRLEMVL